MADQGKNNDKEYNIPAISKSLEKHESALEALKGVPELLKTIADSVGVKKNNEKVKGIEKVKPSWSLGLSDPEEEDDDQEIDVNKLINDSDSKTDSEVDAELESILQDIEKSTEFGPEILPNVSESFIKTVARPLTKESKSNLRDKIKIPSNCKQFLAPKVNQEIWRLLPPQARLTDVKNQQLQQVISSALTNLSVIANTVVANKDKMPKEVTASLVKNAIDGANILGDQFQATSIKRRFEIKKFLNPEYSGICTAQIPPSEWLFGDDLNESLKSSKATSSLIRNTGNRNYRTRPYFNPNQQSFVNRGNYSGNGSRPFLPRGNGPIQRFRQQNPQFRSTTPPQQYNQRFRK